LTFFVEGSNFSNSKLSLEYISWKKKVADVKAGEKIILLLVKNSSESMKIFEQSDMTDD